MDFVTLQPSSKVAPQNWGEVILCIENCEEYHLPLILYGGDSGLSYEYTLILVPEGTTINVQTRGSLEKRQVDGMWKWR